MQIKQWHLSAGGFDGFHLITTTTHTTTQPHTHMHTHHNNNTELSARVDATASWSLSPATSALEKSSSAVRRATQSVACLDSAPLTPRSARSLSLSALRSLIDLELAARSAAWRFLSDLTLPAQFVHKRYEYAFRVPLILHSALRCSRLAFLSSF